MIKFNKNFSLNDGKLTRRKTKRYKSKFQKKPQFNSLFNIKSTQL
jgi:hypothetical protein